MRKCIALLVIIGLLCSVMDGLCDTAYCSIQEMKRMLPARLEKTFETEWGRVDISAELIVPDVETLSLLLVSGGAVEPTISAGEAGWDSIEYQGSYDLYLSNHSPVYPPVVNGSRVGYAAYQEVWRHDFRLENTYVPMSKTTLGEILAIASAHVAALGYLPDNFVWESPQKIQACHIYAETNEEILPGSIEISLSPTVAGIPVLSHIYQTVAAPSVNATDELFHDVQTRIGYNGYADAVTFLHLSPLKPAEVLAKDLPLCPFPQILTAIEKEINAGHIRQVYELKLGYVLCNQPGVYYKKRMSEQEKAAMLSAATYYAKPVWQIDCLYVKEEASENQLLLFDAQTGNLINKSAAHDRCEFQGFITWDEIP